ncbi:MAG: ABC transporter substrate-binding protein, partial [Gemmatimonadetes bacterium]|nr:ABC transporter substrate-binding protein [Gemmatimonadota bacterium]
MRHLLTILVLLFVFSTGRPASADAPGVTDDKILVGMTTDLTGVLAFVGHQSSAGARLYLQHVNEQGGVHGRQIELLVEDDGYQPARTVAAFRKLLDRDGVFCFAGNLGSSQTMATFPFVKRARVPVLMPLNFNSKMSTPHKRYVFAMDPSYPIQSWIMAQYIAAQEHTESPRLAVVYQDDGYGRDGL